MVAILAFIVLQVFRGNPEPEVEDKLVLQLDYRVHQAYGELIRYQRPHCVTCQDYEMYFSMVIKHCTQLLRVQVYCHFHSIRTFK